MEFFSYAYSIYTIQSRFNNIYNVCYILCIHYDSVVQTSKLFICGIIIGESSKYQDIIDFLKYHPLDDKLIEFETKLSSMESIEYLIYKYRFKDNLTFAQISDKLDLDGPRVVEKLDKVVFALRIYCRI